MSAYILDEVNIDYLLTFSREGYLTKDKTEIGNILIEQNYRSVNHRYRENTKAPKYDFRPYLGQIKIPQVLKICACYEYQSCETDDYLTTEAAHIIRMIRNEAINQISGYKDAKWGLEEPRSKAVSLTQLMKQYKKSA